MVASSGAILVGPALREHHRRCVSALTTLLLYARGEDGDPLPARATREMDEAIGEVLDELRGAKKRVIETLSGLGRERTAIGVLEGRFTRTETAAGEIYAALRRGDIPLVRRRVARFQVLVSAMWKIQLDLYASAGGRPASVPAPLPIPVQAARS